MTKILVATMPKKPKDCPFAEYIGMTSKNACRLKSGMYSGCDLELDNTCYKLTTIRDSDRLIECVTCDYYMECRRDIEEPEDYSDGSCKTKDTLKARYGEHN